MIHDDNSSQSPKKVVSIKPAGREGELPPIKLAQYKPDDDLIQSTSRIKSQRDLILDRISKMEEYSGNVSRNVYDKVKRDYILQLDTINEMLAEKKDILKKEIRKLYLLREKLSVEINRHREVLEEAEFRHFLNEFTLAQYQEVESFESREIERVESDLTHINEWIRTHEELFDPQDFGEPSAKTEQTVTKTVPGARFMSPPAQQPAPAKQQQAPAQETAVRAPAPKSEAQAPATKAKSPWESPLQKSPTKVEPTKTPDTNFAESANEFADLFLDDEDSLAEDSLYKAQSEANIRDILESSQSQPPAETTDDGIRSDSISPAAAASLTDGDYFQDHKTEESSSFSIKFDEGAEPLPEPDSVTTSKNSINKPTPAALDKTDRAATPPPTEAAQASVDLRRDDSISNLLESIRLDDEDPATPPPPTKSAAASATEPSTVSVPAKLIVTLGQLDAREYALQENTSIGRSPSNDIVLKEPKVSRQHAAINRYNGQYILIDLKSSNGVFVNGTKVDEYVLQPGDEISVGGYKFQFLTL